MKQFLMRGAVALTVLSLSFFACQDDDPSGSGGSSSSTNPTTTSSSNGGAGGSGGSSSGTAGNTGSEICDDGMDNDGDNFVDCEDFDCMPGPNCLENTAALCGDGMDNDGDGLTDCADDSCHGHPDVTAAMVCVETVCSGGNDEDMDGHIDCDDNDCLATSACHDVPNDGIEAGPNECSDDTDDDNDGFTDCADFSCQNSVPACKEDTMARCSDGIDNNSHSSDTNNFGVHIDCGAGTSGSPDFDCMYGGFCPNEEESTDDDCSDGLDNDGDTYVDCDDRSCQRSVNVTVCEGNARTCSDGLNNNNDPGGFVDCDDFDCRSCGGMFEYSASTCPPCD